MRAVTDILYRKDSEGEIRTWRVTVEGDSYYASSGKLTGKQTKAKPTVCKPKNVGKKNETTGEEQAYKEAWAAVEKKIKEGYRRSIAATDDVDNIYPMLAQKYEPTLELEYPIYSQPKLDGFRCNTQIKERFEGLKTRENETINSCPHINDSIMSVALQEGIIFDGELYNHEFYDNFNGLQSIITKQDPTVEELALSKKFIEYHIYDIVDPNRNFVDRQICLNNLFKKYPQLSVHCVLVKTDVIGSKEELDKCYEEYLEQGYEGQMVRTNSKYEIDKRSKSLLKRKEFEDDEFEIVDVIEGKGNRSGMAGNVIIRLPSGETCETGIKGGFDYYKKLWKEREQLKGQMATVTYFGYTPKGKLRFPVFKGVRK
jgi:ATP-dependent DNA ligase